MWGFLLLGLHSTLSTRDDRFGKLIERQDESDFPFYNEKPAGLSVGQWLMVWLAVAVGYLILVLTPWHGNVQGLLPRFLFLAIPLVAFAYFSKGNWKSLFRKPTFADYRSMVGFFILNLIVTALVAIIVKALFGANANPAADGLAYSGIVEIIAFYIGTGVQLMGEEIFTMLPFLAIVYFFYRTGKVSRKAAVISAWLLTAVWFSLAHLPAYGWNILQVLLVIGTARLILTFPYIRTKNL